MGERVNAGSFWVRAALIAVVLPAAVVVAGCSRSQSATESPADQSFLSEVLTDAPDASSYRSDVQLIRMGHAACEGFSGGASYVELADRLAMQEGSNPLPTTDLGAVISAAARAFCPRYESLVS